MVYMLDRRRRLDENDWLGWAVERWAEPLLFKEDREEGGGRKRCLTTSLFGRDSTGGRLPSVTSSV